MVECRVMYYQTDYESPFGTIALVADGRHLIGAWRYGQKYFYRSLPEYPVYNNKLAVFKDTVQWFDRYFAGEKPQPAELPLAPIGTAFRQAVWQRLCGIPFGSVTTYGALAQKIAAEQGRDRMSAQAIGGAVGHNPLFIIIPCHRVVGANGNLTGYAGGLDVKIQLLEFEGVDTSRFFYV